LIGARVAETQCAAELVSRSIQLDPEIQMNKVLKFSLVLAAVLAGPLHAQVCSGGNDGGMDATGNQCNTPNEVAAGSAITPPTQIAKTGSVRATALRPTPRTNTNRRSAIYASAQVSSLK